MGLAGERGEGAFGAATGVRVRQFTIPQYPRGVYRAGGAHAVITAPPEGNHATHRLEAAMGWLWHALAIAGSPSWQILWAPILGFALSAVVQAVVRRETVVRLLGKDSPTALAAATGLGIASSCSYASVALARSLFRKGASFTAAVAFEIASTNLVVELGIILALLMGWQFTLAEFVGGPIMIVRWRCCSGSSCAAGSFWRRLTSARHRPRAADHRRAGRVDTDALLGEFLPHRPPGPGRDLGASRRAGGRGGQLRLLDR